MHDDDDDDFLHDDDDDLHCMAHTRIQSPSPFPQHDQASKHHGYALYSNK